MVDLRLELATGSRQEFLDLQVRYQHFEVSVITLAGFGLATVQSAIIAVSQG